MFNEVNDVRLTFTIQITNIAIDCIALPAIRYVSFANSAKSIRVASCNQICLVIRLCNRAVQVRDTFYFNEIWRIIKECAVNKSKVFL